jgi:hypothetical protein
LSGWKHEPGHEGHWQPKNWILAYDGKSQATNKDLWTEKEFGDFVLIADWRLTRKPERRPLPVIQPDGTYRTTETGTRQSTEGLDAGDSGIFLRGSTKAQINIWCWPVGSGEIFGYREDTNQPPVIRAAVTLRVRPTHVSGNGIALRLRRGDRVSVILNGKTVVESAQLPGLPRRGPIGLQHHGDPIEFANLLIQELD